MRRATPKQLLLRTILPAAMAPVMIECASAALQPIAWYRLGDDDPGAQSGAIGDDPTLDHTANHYDLGRVGPPRYSADVPGNSAASATVLPSKLSMSFFNFTGPLEIPQPEPNYYTRTSPVPSPNFGLECWVKSSRWGQGDPSGYTLIAYHGDPLSNGVGFFQHDKSYVVRVGSYEKVLAPASSTTWTHLAFVRNQGWSGFYLDGMEEPDNSPAAQAAPNLQQGPFSVGGFGNPLSLSPLPPRYLFSGLVDEVRLFAIPTVTTVSPSDFLIANIPRDLKWSAASGNTWNTTQSNWRDGFDAATWCNTAPDSTHFGADAVNGSVLVPTAVSAGELTFDAVGPAYTLSGGGTITITAPLGAGLSAARSATINTPVNLANDQRWDVTSGQTLTVNAAIGGAGLTKQGGGTLSAAGIDNDSLTLNAGTLALQGSTVRTNHLAVASGARLDLAGGRMIVRGDDLGSYSGTSYTGITSLIASGRNGGGWAGSGIVTSKTDATSGNYTSIGVARASDILPTTASATALWAGQTITGTDTLIMYTYGGDATLDGKINIDDYVKIDSGIAAGLSGWSNGDFNYDGKVNIDDYTTVIDANIGNQNGFVFPTSGGIGEAANVVAVPEPLSATVVLGGGSVAMFCRRRRSP